MTDVASAVAQTLANTGARICFGVAGTSNYRLSVALEKAGIQYVPARHECNAVAMADAYTRHSGNVGLVSVHAGPGLTNAITGMAEAAKSRTGVLVLAGDVRNGDVLSNFYLDQAAVARAVGVVPERINSAATAVTDTVRAYRTACLERRPVLLSLPMDIQSASATTVRDLRPSKAQMALEASSPRLEDIQRLSDLLRAAKRPLVIAGHGAKCSAAHASLVELGEACGALYATSVRAHGFFGQNPWNVGIMGGFATPQAMEIIRKSDLLLGFGVSFTHWTTHEKTLIAPDAKVVQIDVDPIKIGQHHPVDWGLIGDAKSTAEALIDLLRDSFPTNLRGWRTDENRILIEAGWPKNIDFEDTSTEAHIDPRTFTRALDAILPEKRVVALDGGHFLGWPIHFLTIPDAAGWCMTVSFSSTGLGLGTMIGAGLASPDRLAVLCAGDGGFFMSLGDVETAVRLKLRACIVVYNDAAYGAEVHHFPDLDTTIAEFSDTDFASLARGFGARGATVRSLEDLASFKSWIESDEQSVFLLDVKVNPKLIADYYQELIRVAHI